MLKGAWLQTGLGVFRCVVSVWSFALFVSIWGNEWVLNTDEKSISEKVSVGKKSEIRSLFEAVE
jgi:hypothetical protein